MTVDDAPLPAYDPDEPVPESLTIEYRGPDEDFVIVNGENIHVTFRRDGSEASGDTRVLRFDPTTHRPSCFTAFRFTGRYTP
jgi:hypothetical protein